MKLVRVHGPGRYTIDDVAEPEMGPHDAIVQISACGICGSDVHFVRGGVTRAGGEPMPLGHEATGVVTAVGAQVTGVVPGMRVLLNPMGQPTNVIGNGGTEGAFASHVLVRNAALETALIPVPDSVSLIHAALAEPLAVSLHGVNRGRPTSQSRVAVFGCGPIGLGAVLLMARRGVKHIVAIDMSEERLAFARRMGAHATINAGREDVQARLLELHGPGHSTLGRAAVGTDIYFDMAGSPRIIPDIMAMAQFQARLVVTAVYMQPIPIDMTHLLVSEMELTAALGYPTELNDVMRELPDINPALLDEYISHRFPFERFDEGFAVAQQPHSAKVMIEFDSAA